MQINNFGCLAVIKWIVSENIGPFATLIDKEIRMDSSMAFCNWAVCPLSFFFHAKHNLSLSLWKVVQEYISLTNEHQTILSFLL